MTENQLMEVAKKGEPEFKYVGVRHLEWFYNLEEGRAFCVTGAPSPEAVRRAHERAGIPCDEVIPIKVVRE